MIVLLQTPIPFLTSPLRGEEHKDFPPLQRERHNCFPPLQGEGKGGGGIEMRENKWD